MCCKLSRRGPDGGAKSCAFNPGGVKSNKINLALHAESETSLAEGTAAARRLEALHCAGRGKVAMSQGWGLGGPRGGKGDKFGRRD